jgi:hypothetical protein
MQGRRSPPLDDREARDRTLPMRVSWSQVSECNIAKDAPQAYQTVVCPTLRAINFIETSSGKTLGR